jgi:predicted nuclease of predicted toxin-antitoxin system
MKFVIDVGVGRSVEMQLAADGYEVLPVRDRDPHLPDREILRWAVQEQAIVVTMDKDFGDLIWKERLPHAGVMLLRMEDATGAEKADAMRRIVREFGTELPHNFTVFKNDRLRISR